MGAALKNTLAHGHSNRLEVDTALALHISDAGAAPRRGEGVEALVSTLGNLADGDLITVLGRTEVIFVRGRRADCGGGDVDAEAAAGGGVVIIATALVSVGRDRLGGGGDNGSRGRGSCDLAGGGIDGLSPGALSASDGDLQVLSTVGAAGLKGDGLATTTEDLAVTAVHRVADFGCRLGRVRSPMAFAGRASTTTSGASVSLSNGTG